MKTIKHMILDQTSHGSGVNVDMDQKAIYERSKQLSSQEAISEKLSAGDI